MGKMPEHESSDPYKMSEKLRHEQLARAIYDKAELLRLDALERVGINTEGLSPGVRHSIALRSSDYRLRIDIRTDFQLRHDEDTMRGVVITNHPYVNGANGEEFKRGRFVEPDGKMWIAADSSQGEPWYKAELPDTDLEVMVSCMDELQDSNYWVEVTLGAHQQAEAPIVAA